MLLTQIANARDLAVETVPVPVSIGYFPSSHDSVAGLTEVRASGPRPDLNGTRCKFSNRPHIYLIDNGYRRHIPDPTTYNNLFRDWEGVVVDNDIDEIPEARAIQSGAILAKGHATPQVYLIDQGQKRHIVSPDVMEKFHFAWGRIYVVPQILIDAIPTGQPIT